MKVPKNGNLILLCNAITDALREIERCPDDSVQDIFNEQLESWQTGLRMRHDYVLEPNTVMGVSSKNGQST